MLSTPYCQLAIRRYPQENHPDGRLSNSDWFANSFIMVVCEEIFRSLLGHKILIELKKIMNRFTNHSELDILPAGCKCQYGGYFADLTSCSKKRDEKHRNY